MEVILFLIFEFNRVISKKNIFNLSNDQKKDSIFKTALILTRDVEQLFNSLDRFVHEKIMISRESFRFVQKILKTNVMKIL